LNKGARQISKRPILTDEFCGRNTIRGDILSDKRHFLTVLQPWGFRLDVGDVRLGINLLGSHWWNYETSLIYSLHGIANEQDDFPRELNVSVYHQVLRLGLPWNEDLFMGRFEVVDFKTVSPVA